MYPILFKLGPITIYTYGVSVFLGVLFSYWVCLRQAKKEQINAAVFSDIIFWTLLFAFLGARVFYILIEFRRFLSSPMEILLSRSGFVFYGGIIFGILALYFLTRKFKIGFLRVLDIFAIGIPLGHAFGRVGCFFYGCCYGKTTTSFIGVLFPSDSAAGISGVKVVPTQLISAFFLLIIFFLLILLKRKKRFAGQIFLYYIFLYGTFRVIIEFFRGDLRGQIAFLTTSQIISLILIVTGVFLWRRVGRKI
jgi:phosphatidylglycerol:prolipoprotein diacylglycerol transferase